MFEIRHKGVMGVAGALLCGALLSSCGGGGGGDGGGGGSAGVLSMVGVPSFGVISGAAAPTVAPFNVISPSTATQVGPTTFAVGANTDRHFIQMQFSKNVLASSITTGALTGTDGIVIQNSAGANIRYSLDSTGVIDPSNIFPAPGITPTTVRLYINDAVNFGSTEPNRLPAGTYTVNVITQNLVASDGSPFCLAGNTEGNCTNNVEVSYAFNIGTDMAPLAPAPAGASLPLTGSQLAINGEVRLFFDDNVDFQSIIGRTAGGPNFTQRDQFISRPFPVNNFNAVNGTTSAGENVVVTYVPPTGTALPVNYGFVVYMPDPFHNPREVRVRFIDQTLAQPSDTAPNVQNYGLPSTVYVAAGFPAPSSSAGQTFNLPPVLPLPGTTSAGSAFLSVRLTATGSTFGPTDASNSQDGIVGVTDRARNGLATDFVTNFQLQNGPSIANNPSPPDMHILVSSNVLTVLSGGTVTAVSIPVANGDTVIGLPNVVANPLNNPSVLGQVLDIEFGRFINLTAGTNLIHNAPRRAPPNIPITDNNGDEAIPFPAGGNPQTGLLDYTDDGIQNFSTPGPTQALGVRLYIVDGSSNQVKIFDSTTFTLLGTLAGVGSPAGVVIQPNLGFLYVSDFDSSRIVRYGSNPLQTSTFHQQLNSVTVGSNPAGMAVTPNNEDVIVINRGSNTISLVDIASQTQRIELAVGNGPRDVVTTDRMLCAGCTLAYEAYVTNFFSNTVSVYESDSPSINVNNGINGKIFTEVSGFQGPLGAVWNRWSTGTMFPSFQGAYIANSTGNSISELGLTNFGLSPTPGFPGVPEFRTFTIAQTFATSTILGSPSDCTIENLSALSTATGDNKALAKADIGGAGVPSVLLVTYPAAGRVAAYDLATTALFGSVAAPGTAIYSYYDQ